MCRLQSVSTVFLVVAVLSPAAQSFSPLPDHNSSGLVKTVDDEDRYLLHAVSEPLSYDLFLDLTDDSFSGYSGTVDIMVKYTGSEASFSINSAGLTISETSLRVTEANGEEVPIKSFVASNELQQIFFDFDKPLETGAIYKVHIEFNGTISADFFKGLYRSSYRTGTDTKYLATTFFAATYARTVFPCYDEPAYKALFNIRIRHLPKHTALSNMPAIQSIQIGEYKETTFDTTPLMSTYLVAFVVSEFQTIQPDAGLFRVFAPENKLNYTTYAHEFAVRSLRAMETHFGRQNQMPKIDLLAIPDFAMGAMENWGLITFLEDYLLYENEEQTSALAKQKIASIITHELVHMWFGNELTPEWWTYVWLNEGFAKYYEYFITAQLEPAWSFWEQFTLDNVHYALARDCTSSARQMNFYATDPAVLNELYDYVVYQKSASVIHMMRNVIGHETFRQAINDYLRSRSYLSTKPQYLYASVEKFRNVDLPDSVEAIFESWANAPGYPVITVTVDRTRRTLTASQKRFWLTNDVDSPPENKLFFVPLNYASNVASSSDFENTAPTFWLTPSDPSATVVIEADVDWIVVNKQQTGYYRVNYDVESWNKLIAVLNSDRFDTAVPVINRAQLVDDVANLARAGEADYGVALSLMQYLERETEYIPWSTAYNALLYIDQMFSSNKEYKRFESFSRTITAHVFNETTTTDPGEHSNRLHRDKSGYLACYYGVPACLKEATSVLNLALLDESLSIPKEMQSTAFCALHKYELTVEGDYTIALLEKYWSELEKYQSLVDKLIDSMGCSRNRATIEFYLDMVKLNTVAFPFTMKMKSNILTSMIKGSPEARSVTLRYLNVEFVVVSEILDQQLVPVFDAFAVNINTPAERDMLQQLIDTHLSSMTAPVQQAANRALVQAEENLRWLGERADTIAKWLVEQNFDNGDDSDNDNGAETTGPVGGLLAMVGIITVTLRSVATF